MKKTILMSIFFIILLFSANKCQAQLGLFKYSTVYAGIGLNNSINNINTYTIQNNVLSETTIENKFNYRLAFGIKRLARLNYETKGKSYFDGTETKWGLFRSGLINGLEYNFSFEKIRDRSIEYENTNLWTRYLGKYYQIKLESTKLQGIDLRYKSIDLRFKADIRAFQATFGVVGRFHPAHSVEPFKRDFSTNNQFEQIANDLGYYNEFYFYDANGNGHVDRLEQYFYRWFYNGQVIAETTNEFFKYQYSNIINQYNREQIDLLGTQTTMSMVIGLNWYKYNDNFHTLIWLNVLPTHKALTQYGYKNGIDYDFGASIQKNINNNISVYMEIVYLSFFDKQNYTVNTGLNYIIK